MSDCKLDFYFKICYLFDYQIVISILTSLIPKNIYNFDAVHLSVPKIHIYYNEVGIYGDIAVHDLR